MYLNYREESLVIYYDFASRNKVEKYCVMAYNYKEGCCKPVLLLFPMCLRRAFLRTRVIANLRKELLTRRISIRLAFKMLLFMY